MVDFNRNIHCLLGLPVDAISMSEAANRMLDARSTGQRCFLSTPNLNFVIASLQGVRFRDSICVSDLCLADGMPLVWVARLLGIPVRERVSGASLFEHLRKRSSSAWNVFFFGGGKGVGQDACLAIGDQEKSMRPAGYLYPGFSSVEQMSRPDLLDCINNSGADMLVVSLGAAKGQDWICRNGNKLKTPIVSHLGAVINFVAGNIARAPLWMQRSGLEWAWRIKEEPSLLRRYWHDGLGFMRLLATQVIPLAIWQRTIAAPQAEFQRARVVFPHGTDSSTIALTGAWRQDNLEPVRRVFHQLMSRNCSVSVDMSLVTGMDSAFIGLLLLLDGALVDKDMDLHLVNLSPDLQRLLKLSGVNHLYLQ